MPHYLLTYELAPDYLDRRGAFREAHLALAWRLADEGVLLLGGAVGDPPGSALFLFTGEDQAAAFARSDPYVAAGLIRSWQVAPWATVIGSGASTPLRPAG